MDGANSAELEAWAAPESSGGTTASINWLVTDQLGTPRMIFDKSGSLATLMTRDDQLASMKAIAEHEG